MADLTNAVLAIATPASAGTMAVMLGRLHVRQKRTETDVAHHAALLEVVQPTLTRIETKVDLLISPPPRRTRA